MNSSRTIKPNIYRGLFMFTIAIILANGCVPARKYNEMVERRENSERRNRELRQENENLSTQTNELRSERDRLTAQVAQLRIDTTDLGHSLRRLQDSYDRLNKTYNIILDQNEQLMEGKELETTRILKQLQETQDDLMRREDEYKAAIALMQEKEQDLNQLNERLQNFAAELAQKEQRVNELEAYITRQDSVVRALRNTVSSALLGFEGQGLSVEIREGKVYVSMDESLLFATGSTQVGSRGVNALRELAGALEANSDINILIEGHTDDVPMRPGSQIRDNWDLSVLRATAIVRILLENSKIDPQRLTAAGRGEFQPVDEAKTPEARQKNRRTEIILTPRLGDLFQIIEMN